jgi:hypothetical protein
MCEWIRDNASSNDLILYRSPVKVYLYTGHKTMYIPAIVDSKEFLTALYRAGVDYVVLEPSRADVYRYGGSDQIYLQPVVETYPQSFEPLFEAGTEPHLVIYKFLSP